MTDRSTPSPTVRREQSPGPAEFQNQLVRNEFTKAAIWLGLAILLGIAIILIQPIMLILAGIIIASMLDGGVRLLGRVLPLGRKWRLAIVCLAIIAFLAWIVVFAGSQLADQAVALQRMIAVQASKASVWAAENHMIESSPDVQAIMTHITGALGRVTAAVGTVLGGLTSLAMIVVLSVFIAIEPRLYERGIAWMLPISARNEYYGTMAAMGYTLRRLMAGRLLGMIIEGIGTWVLLAIAGIPMAALLGLLTGLFAFIPNIGALISGVLLVIVGFSAGVETGIYAIAIYFIVQTIDGYLIVPMVAKRTVDLAPALVLGAQILFGALLGIIGLALADPIVAMIKLWLEREAERKAGRD